MPCSGPPEVPRLEDQLRTWKKYEAPCGIFTDSKWLRANYAFHAMLARQLPAPVARERYQLGSEGLRKALKEWRRRNP